MSGNVFPYYPVNDASDDKKGHAKTGRCKIHRAYVEVCGRRVTLFQSICDDSTSSALSSIAQSTCESVESAFAQFQDGREECSRLEGETRQWGLVFDGEVQQNICYKPSSFSTELPFPDLSATTFLNGGPNKFCEKVGLDAAKCSEMHSSWPGKVDATHTLVTESEPEHIKKKIIREHVAMHGTGSARDPYVTSPPPPIPSSLFERTSHEQRCELLEYYSKQMTGAGWQESMAIFYGVAKFWDGVWYGVEKGLNYYSAARKNVREFECKVDPLARAEYYIQDKAVEGAGYLFKGAVAVGKAGIEFECNRNPITKMQCDAIRRAWNWSADTAFSLGKTIDEKKNFLATYLNNEFEIPREYTLGFLRGLKGIVAPPTLGFGFKVVSKAYRAYMRFSFTPTLILVDLGKTMPMKSFRDISTKVGSKSGTKAKAPAPTTKSPSGSSTKGGKGETRIDLSELHKENSALSTYWRHSLFENGERLKFSRKLTTEDIGKINKGAKGRIVATNEALRVEAQFLESNPEKYMQMYSSLNQLALKEKSRFVELTSYFRTKEHATTIGRSIAEKYGASKVAHSTHTLSSGQVLEKVTFRSPVKKKPQPTHQGKAPTAPKSPTAPSAPAIPNMPPAPPPPPSSAGDIADMVSKVKRASNILADPSYTYHTFADLRMRQVSALLPEYSAKKELSGITNFVVDQLKLSKGDFVIESREAFLSLCERGRSLNGVYRVTSLKDRKIYWVKSFLYKEVAMNKGQLIPEIRALSILEQLNLPHTRLPEIQGLGKFSRLTQQNVKNKPTRAFMAMNHLPGTSGLSLMKNVGSADPLGPSRAIALQKMEEFGENVATILGQIHQQSRRLGHKPPSSYLETQAYVLRECVKKIAKLGLPIKIHMEKLEKKVIEPFFKNPGDVGLAHGNANLGNFLVDSEGVSLIDTQSLARSQYGMTGKAIGVSARDLEEFVIQVKIHGMLSNMTSQEIDTVTASFLKRYSQEFGGQHTSESKLFFQSFNILQYILGNKKNPKIVNFLAEQFTKDIGNDVIENLTITKQRRLRP